MTYEEANWSKLSPAAREVYNRKRQAVGLAPLPPPAVDLYMPKPSKIRPIEKDQEYTMALHEGHGPRHWLPGDEGFTINGVRNKY
jgi:hypothetical protein